MSEDLAEVKQRAVKSPGEGGFRAEGGQGRGLSRECSRRAPVVARRTAWLETSD